MSGPPPPPPPADPPPQEKKIGPSPFKKSQRALRKHFLTRNPRDNIIQCITLEETYFLDQSAGHYFCSQDRIANGATTYHMNLTNADAVAAYIGGAGRFVVKNEHAQDTTARARELSVALAELQQAIETGVGAINDAQNAEECCEVESEHGQRIDAAEARTKLLASALYERMQCLQDENSSHPVPLRKFPTLTLDPAPGEDSTMGLAHMNDALAAFADAVEFGWWTYELRHSPARNLASFALHVERFPAYYPKATCAAVQAIGLLPPHESVLTKAQVSAATTELAGAISKVVGPKIDELNRELKLRYGER